MNIEDLRIDLGLAASQRLTRSVTLADILALLREWGGVEREGYTDELSGEWSVTELPEPGRYLAVPLDVLAADTGKEQ